MAVVHGSLYDASFLFFHVACFVSDPLLDDSYLLPVTDFLLTGYNHLISFGQTAANDDVLTDIPAQNNAPSACHPSLYNPDERLVVNVDLHEIGSEQDMPVLPADGSINIADHARQETVAAVGHGGPDSVGAGDGICGDAFLTDLSEEGSTGER